MAIISLLEPVMKLFFSDQPLPSSVTKSIFLGGPSPRTPDVHDWRHEALAELKKLGFDGEVFIPIPEHTFNKLHNASDWTYINQIQWEVKARQLADKIVFWIPRDIQGGLPGFTTNFEIGEDFHSGKIIYGRPDHAEKCRYIDARYIELKQPVFNNLHYLLQQTVSDLGTGSLRNAGEAHVPLFIWNTEQFQSWYDSLKQAGNKLIDAKLLHHSHMDKAKQHIFSFILWVNVWVEEEKRFKSNEFIFSRKDISTVVAYFKGQEGNFITFVKEFRSPVNNNTGFVFELPSGSSAKNIDAKTNAQHELFEETGLLIQNINRFEHVGTRQLAATLSTHQAYAYRVQLTVEEFEFLIKKQEHIENVENQHDHEITYVHMINEKDLHKYPIDFSTLGMIQHALSFK